MIEQTTNNNIYVLYHLNPELIYLITSNLGSNYLSFQL